MADLFSEDSLAPRRNPRKNPQQAGEQAGIDSALNTGAQPRTPAAPSAGAGTPSLEDLTNATATVTPPGLRTGGIVAQGSENPALGIVRGDGTFARPSLGGYANNLEGFNMGRFNDPTAQGNDTWKYRTGQVLSNYAPNREGLGQAATYLQGQGVDVRQGGSNGDLLEFGQGVVDENGNPIGTIDVGRGFGAAGSGWAWQPGGAAGGVASGQGGGDLNTAFATIQQMVPPNASKEQMEAAITQAFSGVPGFQGAYKESVNIGGTWYDLVGGYGGNNPSWQLMPKTDSAGSAGFNPSLGGSPLASSSVPGLQSTDPTYAQKFLEMLLGDLGI